MQDDMPPLEETPTTGDEHQDDMPPLQDFPMDVGEPQGLFVMEEVPLDMIGVDQWGNTRAQDPYLINRLTFGIGTTVPYGPPAAQ